MGIPKKFKDVFSSERDTAITSPEISIHHDAKPPILVPLVNESERRGQNRYKVELETVVFCNGESFRTKTLNISVTGVLLAESIPSKFVDQSLDFVMIRHRGGIRDFFLVKGKALEAPLRSPRIIFTDVPVAQQRKILALISNLEKV